MSEGLETILVSVVAFAIWGAALVSAYKVLEIWWQTKPGKWLLKTLPFSQVATKGMMALAFLIITFSLFAVVIVFLHDELGFF